MRGKLSAWARTHLRRSRSAGCAACVLCVCVCVGGLQCRELQREWIFEKNNTLNQWEKKIWWKKCAGWEERTWGAGGLVGVCASERDPVKSETGAGSSRRCCCCHSQDPPGLCVLDVTGLAQIMPVWTFAMHNHTIYTFKYIHVHFTRMHYDIWITEM